MKKYNFNMVEIALAMVVIALGISGILGLFSVGVNAKKAAISENNVADAAEYILGVCKAYISNKYENDESITLEKIGLKERGDTDPNEVNTTDWSVDTDRQFTLDNSTPEPKTSGLYHKGGDNNTIPQIFCYMAVRGNSTDGYVTDSQLQGYIWVSKIQAAFADATGVSGKDGEGNTTKKVELGYQYGVRVHLEVSWPVEKPYEEREKKVFVMDVMNPLLELKAASSSGNGGNA